MQHHVASKGHFPKHAPRLRTRKDVEQSQPPAPTVPTASTVPATIKDEPISKGSGKPESGKKRPRDVGTGEHASQVIPDQEKGLGTPYRCDRLTKEHENSAKHLQYMLDDLPISVGDVPQYYAPRTLSQDLVDLFQLNYSKP